MAYDVRRLVEEVRRLSEQDRIRLVEQILAMLEPEEDRDLADAWEKEVARRSRELEEGSVRGVPWSELKAAARHLADRTEPSS